MSAKQSHELGATVFFLTYFRGRLVRGSGEIVWTCWHAHRSHDAAYRCAVRQRGRRERADRGQS